MQQQPKLTRAEVEQLLERAKAVPAISFGYIRLAEDCLAYMKALEQIEDMAIDGEREAWTMQRLARAVRPASEEHATTE